MHAYLIVGGQGSGKTTVAKMLVEMTMGMRISLSDVVREHAALELDHFPTREDQIRIGEEVRDQTGRNSALAYQSLHNFWMAAVNDDVAQAVIVESIRHPDEIEVFRAECDVKGIGCTVITVLLDDDPEVDELLRGYRVLARGGDGDPKTLNEYMELNYREYYSRADGSFGPYIEGCVNYPSAVRVYNSRDLIFLKQQLEMLVVREVNAEQKINIR